MNKKKADKPDSIAATEAAARAEGKSYGQYQLEKMVPPPTPKRSYRQWTQHEKNEIRAMYASGSTIDEIAAKFDADKSKIQTIAYGHRGKAGETELDMVGAETTASSVELAEAETEAVRPPDSSAAGALIEIIDALAACADLLGCDEIIAVSCDRAAHQAHICFKCGDAMRTLRLE